LGFAPDGKTLAVGYLKIQKGYHCSLAIWDLSSGKKRIQFSTPGSSIPQVSYTPDGKQVVTSNGWIQAWDPASGKEIGKFQTNGLGISFGGLRFSPDGALLAGPSHAKGFGVWTAATRELVDLFESGVTARSVAFSSDSRLLACGKENGTVELWDTRTWQVLGEGKGPNSRVNALAFSKDDHTLVSAHENATALVWDVAKLLPKK
jgi:WD40 repeat protein